MSLKAHSLNLSLVSWLESLQSTSAAYRMLYMLQSPFLTMKLQVCVVARGNLYWLYDASRKDIKEIHQTTSLFLKSGLNRCCWGRTVLFPDFSIALWSSGAGWLGQQRSTISKERFLQFLNAGENGTPTMPRGLRISLQGAPKHACRKWLTSCKQMANSTSSSSFPCRIHGTNVYFSLIYQS